MPEEVRGVLIGELLSSPGAIVMGAINGLLVNIVALFLHYEPVFVVLTIFELCCAITRLVVIRAVLHAKQARTRVPVDAALAMSIIWCTLQGTLAFVAMRTGNQTLQVLAATLTMGIIGPICARNFPAPRLAFLLLCLCDLPFVAGSCLSGQTWLLVMLPMTPPFLYGMMQIVTTFQKLAVKALMSELASKKDARRDALTGLLNRLAFNEALKQSMNAKRRFVMLCLDLDNFKHVNDTFGHHAGDTLLSAVARRLEASVRSRDSIFRLGGDEFVILAQDMPMDVADMFADRIIARVSSESYQFEGMPPIRIGISIGYACGPGDGTNTEDLHRRADAALYASKAAGKGVHRRFELQLAS